MGRRELPAHQKRVVVLKNSLGAGESAINLRAMDNEIFEKASGYTSRLEFLFKAVEDTQNTIRFLDTKAAFCVTLLTAMMVAFFHFSNRHRHYPHAHLLLVALFAGSSLICLSLCVRVIFPTIHLQGAFSVAAAAGPPFFLVPEWQRNRLRDTLGNPPPKGLEATHASYTASVLAASDLDLVESMCDEVVTISFLRQVKSDRLHLAILVLLFTMFAFVLQLAI